MEYLIIYLKSYEDLCMQDYIEDLLDSGYDDMDDDLTDDYSEF
jgi:hypothetical protein